MTILVTGVGGFIGFHVAQALLARGEQVVGIDNLNAYYEVSLKEARLAQLEGRNGFTFRKADIAEPALVDDVLAAFPDIAGIIHLAAQAGVRYSLVDPYAYIRSNVMGQTVMLELARRLPKLGHFVYASSSSVYGGNTKLPFSVGDPVDTPVSLYAATKRADELLGQSYVHLYGLKMTGLRFFTVYGPWGRPDMSPYIFARAIFAGKPIEVFSYGKVKRDFSYIDDIVAGVLAAYDRPPAAPANRLYNLGASSSEELMRFIGLIEQAIGKTAVMELKPPVAGDVPETYADVAATQRELDWRPQFSIDQGIPRFIDWFRAYHKP
jgi:UDP-glucuronate 4-epimerase